MAMQERAAIKNKSDVFKIYWVNQNKDSNQISRMNTFYKYEINIYERAFTDRGTIREANVRDLSQIDYRTVLNFCVSFWFSFIFVNERSNENEEIQPW